MSNKKPKFDPKAPFDVLDQVKPPFDPNAPHEVVGDPISFAPGKMPKVQANLSLPQQIGGAIEAAGSTMGGQQLGAGIEATTDYVMHGGQQPFSDYYDNRLGARQQQLQGLQDTAPQIKQAGETDARIAQGMAAGGYGLGAMTAGSGLGGMVQEQTDILGDPNTADERALKTGGMDAGITLATGGLLKGAGAVASSMTPEVNSSIQGLKDFATKLGVKPSVAREGMQDMVAGTERSGNPLVKAQTLIKTAAFKGVKTTIDAAQAVKNIITENSSKVANILKGEAGSKEVELPIAAFSHSQSLLDDIPTEQLHEQAETLLRKAAPKSNELIVKQVLPESPDSTTGVIKGSIRQLQKIKERLNEELAGHYLKAEKGLPSAFNTDEAKILGSVRDNLAKVIETNAPEVGPLNKETSAAYYFKPYIKKLEDSGTEVGQGKVMSVILKTAKNPLAQTTAAAITGYGLGGTAGAATGAALVGGGRYMAASPPLSSSIQQAIGGSGMIKRSAQSLITLLGSPEAQQILTPEMSKMAHDFIGMPKDQQDQVAPLIFDQLDQAGLHVEPPTTGYKSEVDGKITNPRDVLDASAQLDKQKSSMGIIEWAKQKRALHQDGSMPAPQAEEPKMLSYSPQEMGLAKQALNPPMPASDTAANSMLNRTKK